MYILMDKHLEYHLETCFLSILFSNTSLRTSNMLILHTKNTTALSTSQIMMNFPYIYIYIYYICIIYIYIYIHAVICACIVHLCNPDREYTFNISTPSWSFPYYAGTIQNHQHVEWSTKKRKTPSLLAASCWLLKYIKN